MPAHCLVGMQGCSGADAPTALPPLTVASLSSKPSAHTVPCRSAQERKGVCVTRASAPRAGAGLALALASRAPLARMQPCFHSTPRPLLPRLHHSSHPACRCSPRSRPPASAPLHSVGTSSSAVGRCARMACMACRTVRARGGGQGWCKRRYAAGHQASQGNTHQRVGLRWRTRCLRRCCRCGGQGGRSGACNAQAAHRIALRLPAAAARTPSPVVAALSAAVDLMVTVIQPALPAHALRPG